ncbi:MAG: hypothetical protein ACK5P7_10080 [Bdellovibrio sp.]|jgi:hypothetical protein
MSTTESLVTFPVLIGLVLLIITTMALSGLRLSMIKATEDFASCHHSTARQPECLWKARKGLQSLLDLGGFSHVQISGWFRAPKAHLVVRARWGQFPLSWHLQAQSPLPSVTFR